MKTYLSFSSNETKKLGEALARKVKRARGAAVFALKGDLGAGKTTFVQGFLKGLGIRKRAPSPTFVIMRRHALPRRRAAGSRAVAFTNIFHIDAYRLKKAEHLAALGLKEILTDPKHIVLIEWADRVKKILPKGTSWLVFKHRKHGNERHIIMK